MPARSAASITTFCESAPASAVTFVATVHAETSVPPCDGATSAVTVASAGSSCEKATSALMPAAVRESDETERSAGWSVTATPSASTSRR